MHRPYGMAAPYVGVRSTSMLRSSGCRYQHAARTEPVRGPSRGSGPSPLRHRSATGLVRLDDRLRDAAAVADLVAALACPLADRGRLLTVRASRLLGRCSLLLAPPAAASARLASDADVWREGVAEFGSVVVRQVDLVVPALEGEVEGARCVRAVEVVDEPHGRLLCHVRFHPCRRG